MSSLIQFSLIVVRCKNKRGVRLTAKQRCNFKRLSRDGGGRAGLSKNLHASLFNDDLSKKPNFGWIHLAKQYLFGLFERPGIPQNKTLKI
jgi:hypothetical protein